MTGRRLCLPPRPAPAATLLLAALLALDPGAAQGYTLSSVSAADGHAIAWDLANEGTWLPNVADGRVLYSLQPAGSADVTDGSDLAAVEKAFATWSGVTGSSLRFARDVDLSQGSTLDDGLLSVFWTETGTVIDQGTAAVEDDVSVAGALAVAFVYRVVSGPERGEIRDANIVFNGADFLWTASTPPAPGRFDIESVALHEIGHVLGLDHSPVAAATLFPRISAGSDTARSLGTDDAFGVATLYPGDNVAAGRGAVIGKVDSSGLPVFGAMVWARDSAGRTLASSISDPNGSYRLEGLPPGDITLHAQPLGDPTSFSLFSAPNLGPFYAGAGRGFGYAGGLAVTVAAGQESVADLTLPNGAPPLEIKLLSRGGSWSNIGVNLRRGEHSVRIGAAGPGLPASGLPLSITGPGLTLETAWFGSVAGLPTVEVRVHVAEDAPLGPRDLVITAPGGTAVALGGIEIRHPAAESLPGPVQGLRVWRHGPGLDLDWQPAAGASRYRLFRGSLAGLREVGYDHKQAGSCDLSVPWASLMDEVEDPGLRYFLISAADDSGATGLPGTAGDGSPRPLGIDACP